MCIRDRYFAGKEPIAHLDLPDLPKVRAGLRLRLRTTLPGLTFDKLGLERLPIFLHGSDTVPARLYEQLLGNAAVSYTHLDVYKRQGKQRSGCSPWIYPRGWIPAVRKSWAYQ